MKSNAIVVTSCVWICLAALVFSLSAGSLVRADIAAEWTFEADEDMTAAPAGVTKACSLLGTTTVNTGPTGISTKWASYLRNGFMTVPGGNERGVTPIAKATALFQHSDVEGTFYGVMQPNEDLTTFIFGVFGISTEGTDPGYVSSKISYGPWHSWAGRAPGPANRANTAVYDVPWDTEKWYFMALSWAPGADSVMYVREMAAGGPAVSPAGAVGSVNPGTNALDAYISADAPLLFGGWIQGGNFADGTRADWAWGQFLNTASALEDMQAKFDSLTSAPNNCDEVWSSGFGMPIDLNRDCYVGLADFSLFAGAWLRCNQPGVGQCEETW